MKFDKIVSKGTDECIINYGIVFGNNDIVFIKSGAGGSHIGYENKYLKMAKKIHDKDGATVICASNPSDELSLKYDEEIIAEFIKNLKASSVKFIGASRGAYLGLTYLSEKIDFSKLLLINMPLMLNFHKSTKALYGKNVTFVYGQLDPSASYIPFLKRYCEDIVIISEADHQFRNMTEVFVDLVKFI